MVQGKHVTIISSRRGVSSTEQKRIAKMLGLATKGMKRSTVQDMLAPALEKVFISVRRRYRDLISRSSLLLGPYKKIEGSKGAYDSGSLYNALSEIPLKTKQTTRGVQMTWGVQAENPADDPDRFNRADKGWSNTLPNYGSIFEWANRKFKWGLPSYRNVKDNLLTVLRESGAVVHFGGTAMRADRALAMLYRALRYRRYKGLRIRRHMREWTQSEMAKAFQRGRILTPEQVAKLLQS